MGRLKRRGLKAAAVVGLVLLAVMLPGIASARSTVRVRFRAPAAVKSDGLAVFRGRVLGSRSGRVVVQRRAPSGWTRIAAGRRAKTGTFALTWIVRLRPGRIRVRVVAYEGSRVVAASLPRRLVVKARGGAAVVVSPKTVVVSSTTVRSAPEPGTVGVLSYAGGNTVQAGQIVAIGVGPATPDGFLGQVTSVKSTGGETVVSTKPATLLQAIKTGSFDEKFGSPTSALSHAAKRALIRAASSSLSCSGSASAKLTAPTPSLGISLEPRAHWSFFRLKSASLSARAHADGSLTATLTGQGSCSLSPTTIAKFAGPTAAFSIGPVPVVITSEITVDVEADAQAGASLTTGIRVGFDAQAGIGWTRNNGFYPIDSFTQKFTYTPPTLTANASAEAQLIPKVNVLFYGVGGPEIALKSGLGLNADTTKNPWWTLSAPVDLSAKLDVPELGLSSPTLDVYKHTFTLATSSGGFPGGATVTVTNPGDQTSTVGAAVGLQIEASDSAGSMLTYTATGLPAGLSINHSSGRISGILTTAGTTSVTVTATDAGGNSAKTQFGWTVNAEAGGGSASLEALAAPLPLGTPDGTLSTINSVSCPTDGNCTAAGMYDSGFGGPPGEGLLLSEVDGVWQPGQEAPLPANVSGTAEIYAVSCASPGNCGAVGIYQDDSGSGGELLLDETNGTWRATLATVVLRDGEIGFPDATAISCPAAGNCSAVGSYDDSPDQEALLLDEVNGVWQAGTSASLPDDSQTAHTAGLDSVSCASAGNCAAVGWYVTSSGIDSGLLLNEKNGAWGNGVEAALPPGVPTNHTGALTSVSCPAAGDCSAAGAFTTSDNSETNGLLLNETNGIWQTAVEAPLPAGGMGMGEEKLSISCTSPGNCGAAGMYYDTAFMDHGLLLNETNGTWAAGIDATLPSNADTTQPAGLSSISCPAVGNCTAVGFYVDQTSAQQALLLNEHDGVWHPGLETPLPSDAVPYSFPELDSVSCASAENCTAGGVYNHTEPRYSFGLLLDEIPPG